MSYDLNDQCETSRKCTIDPSLILLERVQRAFAGSYSCQGRNAAGWGPRSAQKELQVYCKYFSLFVCVWLGARNWLKKKKNVSDPPHATKVRYEPSRVIKGASVTLHCQVDDPGHPDNITYRWYKGGYLIKDRNSSVWTIEPVTLSDRTNFTCVAENEGGHSKPSTVYINVSGKWKK